MTPSMTSLSQNKSPAQESKSKSFVANALKWGLAFVLLVAVIKSGKLSLKDLQTFLSKPQAALECVGISALIVFLSIVRWRTLLKALRLPISLGSAFRLGMLGQFFSTVIPGTVGGDLVKAVYVARRYPLQKARAVSTLLADRICGVCGLVILGGTAFLVGHAKFATLSSPGAPVLRAFGALLALIALGLIVGLILLPWMGARLPKTLPSWANKKILSSLYEIALDYRADVGALWRVLGVSIVMHILNLTVLWLVAHAIYGSPPWGSIELSSFVLASVLGLCAMGLPVAPLGLGVGQVAFSAIFATLGAPSSSFGAALVTGFQIVAFLVNITGCVFFATYKHEVQLADA